MITWPSGYRTGSGPGTASYSSPPGCVLPGDGASPADLISPHGMPLATGHHCAASSAVAATRTRLEPPVPRLT